MCGARLRCRNLQNRIQDTGGEGEATCRGVLTVTVRLLTDSFFYTYHVQLFPGTVSVAQAHVAARSYLFSILCELQFCVLKL